MAGYGRAEAAERAGVGPAYFDRLTQLGIVRPDELGTFSPGQIKRAQLAASLDGAGISLDGLAAGLESGDVSFDFLESEQYERFSALADETFRDVSQRTGVPFELLAVVREAMGLAQPAPHDRLREDELSVVPFVAAQVRLGFRPAAIERLLRVTGDSLGRIAEQEADWWRTEVMEPALAAGATGDALSGSFADENSDELARLANRQLQAIYDARRAHAWTSNIVGALELALARAGLHSRLETPPAICFLDITGYTRLTQERGDAAAAEMADRFKRLVQRTSAAFDGRPVKWLGDGVMIHFRQPGNAVLAALDMVEGVTDSGLPRAHVGIDAGPVLFQEGDYFGTTVNVAARIADYARPGEVLVSRAVVDASEAQPLRFADIGPVELKGVTAPVPLYAAHRA